MPQIALLLIVSRMLSLIFRQFSLNFSILFEISSEYQPSSPENGDPLHRNSELFDWDGDLT
jgi:hypothetical protein